MVRSRPAEVDRLVASYPDQTQALIDASRAKLRAVFPGVTESADRKARLLSYSYGAGYTGTVATLILSRSGVKIGIPYGAQLADPHGLLAGAGKVHRHVAIESPSQLRTRALTALLRATLAAWKTRTRAS
jgi:hypothetical protein